ncbi:MAG: Glu-tRNA(Gln) amidotransferase subunit GatD [Candidatus Thermoplasmatota archaeon]|nr:Glu-tRNA(Gln) amidotransferase subunit GatD [Candidatus Thermoplasmatota archaeon]
MRSDEVARRLQEMGAGEGDYVSIDKRGERYQGVLMPHHSFSHPDVVTLKLDDGYNIGIAIDDHTHLRLVEKRSPPEPRGGSIPHDGRKPSIALLGTGGTIASYVEYQTGAVHPATTTEEMALSVPEIFSLCNVHPRIVAQKLSENVVPADWQVLAEAVAEELRAGAAGVVVSHGTDTLGYTAAALSFMLDSLTGPVVLVGAQRSSDRPSSDAGLNLMAAVKTALTDLGEVAVVMHGTPSPEYATIHRGTKVRKMHASRRDAFQSINALPLGYVEDDVRFVGPYRGAGEGETMARTDLNTSVALVPCYPGMPPDDFARLAQGKDGVVVAGTGLGHVHESWVPVIEDLVGQGTLVVMTTQCLWGRVNLNVYATGRKLLRSGVIGGEDMLPETALVKLMWVLANSDNPVADMQANLAGEIAARTLYEAYPGQKKYM